MRKIIDRKVETNPKSSMMFLVTTLHLELSMLALFFFFFFEITQKSDKNSREFSYTLHPAPPNINILHTHNKGAKTKNIGKIQCKI